MGKQTSFYEQHVNAQAKIVDFAGWDMPLHYGSQITEHHQVRQHVGMFDVSHMGVVDVNGPDSAAFLRYLLANNIDKISIGKALYSCMLNEQGGILDDLIVYKIKEDEFRLVINAGTRQKDLTWMVQQTRSFNLKLNERTDLCMLALQGPQAKDKLIAWLPEIAESVQDLKPFSFILNKDWLIARTGYTGEDGYELIFPASEASKVWQTLLQLHVTPCGLGARDTLRLEAGLNLYGADMDESVTPFESNLGWTVAIEPKERQFIGRRALEIQLDNGVKQALVGLVLQGPGIIRNHQKVWIEQNGEGEITSGGYAPTLEKSIALARVPVDFGSECFVEIRQKSILAQVIKPPFVRHGKKMF